MPLGRSVFVGVEDLGRDIEAFATNLLDTMLDVATNAIGAISDLAVKVAEEIKNALKLDDTRAYASPRLAPERSATSTAATKRTSWKNWMT